MSFFDFLKNIFFLLIFIQFVPPLIENAQKQYTRYMSPRTKVGVLTFSGVLYDSNYHIKHLNSFFKDNDIKAILLRIDSSGSASGTGQAIQHELLELKQQYHKPVIVLVENMCASGAYYIASAADYIIASGCATIGSIGVTIPYLFQLQDCIEEHKVHYVSLKAGKYKNITDPFVTLSADDKQHLQGVLDDSYEQFTADVARNRSLPLSTVNTWADGKLFSGRQALKLGLIDEIGSAYNVQKVIRDKAIIEGDIVWVNPPEKTSFWNIFSGSDDESDTNMFSAAISQFGQLCSTLLQKITIANGAQIT